MWNRLYVPSCSVLNIIPASSTMSTFAEQSQADVLSRQSTKPVQLNKIAITGGDFTTEYLQKLVDLALNEKPVMSFGELQGSLVEMEQKLLYTGLFRDIRIKLDLDTAATTTPKTPVPVEAAVTLSDMPMFKYSSYSRSTDYDVAGGIRYLHPNFTQNADTLLADINFNFDPLAKSVNRKVWDVTYLHPLVNTVSSRVVVNPTVATIDATKWASHQQYAVGAFLGFQKAQLLQKCQGSAIFTAGLSGTLRQVTDIANSASDSIRTFAGGDMKLGATANWKVESRQFVGQFATDGFLLDVTNEFAGHNSVDHHAFQQGNSQQQIELQPFNKSSVKFEGVKSFFNKNFTAAVDVEAGVIKSIGEGGSDSLHISDRFFLGGLKSLKGFQLNSVGLKNGNDYIGGTSAFKLGLSLFTRVPNTKASSPLRFYGFLNAGDVHSFEALGKGMQSITSGEILSKAAAATGLGLAYRADNATLDLSYNVPLTSRVQDEAKPGLSFAVVLNFK